MRISDWSSDVCSSDLLQVVEQNLAGNLAFALGLNCQVFFDSCLLLQLALVQNVPNMQADALLGRLEQLGHLGLAQPYAAVARLSTLERIVRIKTVLARTGLSRSTLYRKTARSDEHTSELQSLMRISYAVF